MKQIPKLSNKKAQGALEFLMTYGWAFLVILIMIGALAYFGVLSPTKFLPERCTFGSQFLCKDYLITYDSSSSTVDITLKLQNNLGQATYILTNTTNATSQEGFGGCTITIADNSGNDIGSEATGDGTAVSDGGYFVVTAADCSSLGGMVPGSKYKISTDVGYYAATSSIAFAHTAQGEVFANVEGE